MQLFRRFVTGCLLFPALAFAQQDDHAWGLQRCVQYAVEHNISIKQDSLTARLAKYSLLQSRLSQIPSASVQSNYGTSFGRSINPTTNQFVEGDYNYLSASGTASALLFSGLQVRNNIQKNKFSLEAALADLDQLKDDISVNVANSFLAVLLAKEQINIGKNQVMLSQAQLDQTRKFAESGRLPELNVAQLESQVASDSSTLINSISAYNSSVLDLKALLNLDFNQPFEIDVPPLEPAELMTDVMLQPEEIFEKARTHFGSIKSGKLKVAAAEKGLNAAKGGLYPQLSLGYQVGTNYSSNYQTYNTTQIPDIYQTNTFRDSAKHASLNVYTPTYTTSLSSMSFNDQFSTNLRHSVYLNLNVPIFSGWQAQYNIRQAKINLNSQQLNEYSNELTLKQNVYKAHNNAVGSIQKYNAAKRADQAATRALDFAKKRYDLGLTSTVDLIVTQNAQFNAASNLAIAKFDLIFKLKVIDYYLGKELKL